MPNNLKTTTYCQTCRKHVEVKGTVIDCEKEIIFLLMCGHERHVWKNRDKL